MIKTNMLSIFLVFAITSGLCKANDYPIDRVLSAEIIQKLLDDSNLNKHFHIDVFPERSPLTIVVNNYFDGNIVVRKFNREVVIARNIRSAKTDIYLEITSVKTDDDEVEVSFRYRPEGIRGFVIFKRTAKNWELSEQEIIEM